MADDNVSTRKELRIEQDPQIAEQGINNVDSTWKVPSERHMQLGPFENTQNTDKLTFSGSNLNDHVIDVEQTFLSTNFTIEMIDSTVASYVYGAFAAAYAPTDVECVGWTFTKQGSGGMGINPHFHAVPINLGDRIYKTGTIEFGNQTLQSVLQKQHQIEADFLQRITPHQAIDTVLSDTYLQPFDRDEHGYVLTKYANLHSNDPWMQIQSFSALPSPNSVFLGQTVANADEARDASTFINQTIIRCKGNPYYNDFRRASNLAFTPTSGYLATQGNPTIDVNIYKRYVTLNLPLSRYFSYLRNENIRFIPAGNFKVIMNIETDMTNLLFSTVANFADATLNNRVAPLVPLLQPNKYKVSINTARLFVKYRPAYQLGGFIKEDDRIYYPDRYVVDTRALSAGKSFSFTTSPSLKTILVAFRASKESDFCPNWQYIAPAQSLRVSVVVSGTPIPAVPLTMELDVWGDIGQFSQPNSFSDPQQMPYSSADASGYKLYALGDERIAARHWGNNAGEIRIAYQDFVTLMNRKSTGSMAGNHLCQSSVSQERYKNDSFYLCYPLLPDGDLINNNDRAYDVQIDIETSGNLPKVLTMVTGGDPNKPSLTALTENDIEVVIVRINSEALRWSAQSEFFDGGK